MKTNEVKILLQRYFDAETSADEERLLEAYFRENSVEKELEPYQVLFRGMGELGSESRDEAWEAEIMHHLLEQETAPQKNSRRLWYNLSGIAASLLIVLGGVLFYQQRQHPFRDSFSDPEAAVAYAQETLQFISSKYNKGLAQLTPISKLESAARPLENSLKTINKGFSEFENVQHLNQLSKNE